MQICGHYASRMVSPITLAVVSEDGRGTSARIEIVEAARGVMQLAGRSGDVRSWRQSGRHMLVWSFSAFDPKQPPDRLFAVQLLTALKRPLC
jgi:hypothetical protein